MNQYFLDYSFKIEVIFNQLSYCINCKRDYYFLAETKDAVYITFRSSHELDDFFTDVNILPEFSDEIINGYTHFGFTERANSVDNIEDIYRNATNQDKKIIIGGHSLGGAAASICAFNLLKNHLDSDNI